MKCQIYLSISEAQPNFCDKVTKKCKPNEMPNLFEHLPFPIGRRPKGSEAQPNFCDKVTKKCKPNEMPNLFEHLPFPIGRRPKGSVAAKQALKKCKAREKPNLFAVFLYFSQSCCKFAPAYNL